MFKLKYSFMYISLGFGYANDELKMIRQYRSGKNRLKKERMKEKRKDNQEKLIPSFALFLLA